MKKVNLSPNPVSLIESMRDIGYSLETAISDIIDNSITARAKNISIRFDSNASDSWIAIVDDGIGMTEDELVFAMRLGSQNPLKERSENDLGRFGLGLKTASFSQCRRLTVLTQINNVVTCAKWDIDFLANQTSNEWTMCLLDEQEVENCGILLKLRNTYLQNNQSGTIVLWENIDRIIEKNRAHTREQSFNEALANVKNHLELVFHRYLSPQPGESKISIYFNKSPLEAFDPFNTKSSTELRSEKFTYEQSVIKVQPYILPHHNKTTKTEWKKYAGNQGYLHGQGFYIYRNRRLIIYATWFRLIKKEELTKLLRVMVDIPNTLDHLWKIDVKKSNAFPPYGVRKELQRIIGKIEFSGKKVYKQRGQRVTEKTIHPAWKRVAKNNQIFYQINKEHPIIVKYLEKISENDKENFENILSMIETTFPRESFYSDSASIPEEMIGNTMEKKQIESMLRIFIGDDKISKTKLNEILQIEPFASNQEITKTVIRDFGYEL
ncbi:MAG: ATPase [Melioribacteraceae bacterium]|nr:MAG: ATPase [Melioribacteraceae bacterium]